MARNLDVAIELKLDDNGAIKKVTQLNKGLKGTEPAANVATAGLSRMKTMIGGIGLAIAAAKIGRWMRDSTEAAAEQQRVFNSLAVGLGNAGVAYNDVGRDLQNMFTHLQETTKYGDTDTAQTLQKLVTITGDYDAAMKLLEPTLDFATAMQIDMATAARLTGQAATGMTGTLSRYGIVLDDVTKELIANADEMGRAEIMAAELQKRFGGAAAAELQDYAGRIQQVGNYWGDFGEAVGDVIVKTAAAPGVFNKLIDSFKFLTDYAKDFGEVIVFIGNFDFGKAVQAYSRKAEAAFLRLFARVNRELAKLPKWLGGGDDKVYESQVLEMAAAMIEKMAEANLDEVFIKASDAANVFRDEVENVTAAASGPGGMMDELEKTGAVGEDVFSSLANTVVLTVGQHGPFYAAFANMRKQAESDFDGVADAAEGLANDTAGAFGDITSSFSDMLGKGFTGEFESFSDLWDELWKDLAKSMSGIIGDAFEDAMKDGGTLGGIGARFIDNLKTSIEKNALGAGLGGAGMMMQASQQGGAGGVLQGAMGGMGVGGAIGSLFPGAGTVIGMGVGAAVGAIVGLFGGKDDPRMGFTHSAGGFDITSARGQDFGTGEREQWERNMDAVVRESELAYRGLLKMFGDDGLFSLVGSMGDTTFGSMEGTASEIADYIANEWLPFQMETIFGQALAQGFGDLGLGAGEIENLFDELNSLSGEDRINALQDVISALVMFNDALTNFGTGDQLRAFMDRSPMQVFADDMAEVRDSIDLVTVGWENMSLQDRAREAQEIGVLFQGALQNTLAMLGQIDQARQSINTGFDRMLEDLRLENMTDYGKQRFFSGRVGTLTGELAGATDPAEIARITAEIQNYIQSLRGLVDLDETNAITGFGTWNEYITGLITEAQNAANIQLDAIEDEVLGEYDRLIERMQLAEDALTGFTTAVAGATGDGASGGSGGDPVDGDPKSTRVLIDVGLNRDPLVNLVYQIVYDVVGDDAGSIQ